MPKSSKPHWLKRDNIPEDPYEFEEHDARSLSDGKIGATPGSGRLFPGQLDSEVGDFKTDNKVTKHDSYGLNKWFWWERIEKAKGSDHNFRESILFRANFVAGKPTDDDIPQLHLVVLEASVAKELEDGYRKYIKAIEDGIIEPEVNNEPGKNAPHWINRD